MEGQGKLIFENVKSVKKKTNNSILKIIQMHAFFFHIKNILDLQGTMDTYKKCEHFQSFGEEKAGMERVTAKMGELCHCDAFWCLVKKHSQENEKANYRHI